MIPLSVLVTGDQRKSSQQQKERPATDFWVRFGKVSDDEEGVSRELSGSDNSRCRVKVRGRETKDK